MKNGDRLSVSVAVGLALVLSPAQAQQSTEDELLGEVTVTGSRVERSGFRRPLPQPWSRRKTCSERRPSPYPKP